MQTAAIAEKPRKQAISGHFWADRTYRGRIKDDHKIDPCCGTGSFLEQIVAHDPGDGEYNLCGFEILLAPYMLANYRMALVERHYGRQNLKPNIILILGVDDTIMKDKTQD